MVGNTFEISHFQSRNVRTMPPRVPAPSYRHGTPSGPWPFLDLDDKIDPRQLRNSEPKKASTKCAHLKATCGSCWKRYPQSLFPNWTPAQQRTSRIARAIERRVDCKIRYIDVQGDGIFTRAGVEEVTDENQDAIWEGVMQQPRHKDTRIRAVFLENLSGSVLQMLGTKYNVEPFYWTSSLGWIPSRYQEAVVPGEGDHITITMTFIRSMDNPNSPAPSIASSMSSSTTIRRSAQAAKQVIDTQAPLLLTSNNRLLLPDLLSLHMVRNNTNSTILSYHAGADHRATAAKALQDRLHSAGQSVYWHNIISRNKDPTFAFLTLLWYALYAWDEALEDLYSHICQLETEVIQTNDITLTQELHIVRAHLLHYASLLEDFRKTIVFVMETPFPGLFNEELFSSEERINSQDRMQDECKHLLGEVKRLMMNRDMQDKRVKNAMNLGFSSVNIQDSKDMQKLTEAAVRDSAAMKQISYMTMIFLPASFAAAIYGMNVKEINPGSNGTLAHYFEAALSFTAASIWIIVALQFRNGVLDEEPDPDDFSRIGPRKVEMTFWVRMCWPFIILAELFKGKQSRRPITTGKQQGLASVFQSVDSL